MIQFIKYSFVIGFITISTLLNAQNSSDSISNITTKETVELMNKVTDWQLSNPNGKELWAWEYGTFYAGLINYYQTNPQKKYLKAMLNMGEEYNWQLKPHPYNADNLAISQTYIDLYEIKKKPEMICISKYVMDMAFHKRPRKIDLTWTDNPHKLNWWSWCDALFMAPPAFAKMSKATNDPKYIDEMDRLWKYTYRHLYNKKQQLFFRDDSFFDKTTTNGYNVFWSRGNGWVMAGLVRVLDAMPKDYHNRSFYESLLKKMCKRIIQIQSPEGHWYISLLDKDDFNTPESSGTAFYCYALAWGINNGLLDSETYLPALQKGWNSLSKAIQEDGKLGFVQRVGVGPDSVKKEDTEPYGVGAFLLAGSELLKLLEKHPTIL